MNGDQACSCLGWGREWLTSTWVGASYGTCPAHGPVSRPFNSPTWRFLGLSLSFFSHVGSINLDNLQSLSSDNATMAMQQAMMAAHDDSLDGTEEEDEDEMEEEEEEELEEEADELQTTNVSDLGLEHSDSLE